MHGRILIFCRKFEEIVVDFDRGISFVPLSFVLGFYVAVVVRRYWRMWETLPWPDPIAVRITTTISGQVGRPLGSLQ
jgi:hypothetical protein